MKGAMVMRSLSVIVMLLLTITLGCSSQETPSTLEVISFIEELKSNGVDGSLEIQVPDNPDIEYIATYVVAAYTSTRIISFFKFTNEERAEFNLAEAMKNPKFAGQARNGTLLMAATFYPPDEEAVNKIKALFLAHTFHRPDNQ